MSATNFSFVTIEYLEAYGNRLRWNSAANIPINGLAIFIILKYSSPAMRIYKYFILATVISAFVMDFHSSFIYGFFNFVPAPISCPTGITKNLGWFWGSDVNFTSFHFTLSFCGLSLTYSIIYQYVSLVNDTEIFEKPKTIVAIFISAILYPLPSAIAYHFTLDHEAAKIYVASNYPEIIEIFNAGSCDAQIISSKYFMHYTIVTIQVFAIFAFAVIILIILAFKLEKLKHSLSSNTLKTYKQYIFALVIQDPFEWAFQCFGLHSCVNAIAVMGIIKPYRNALIKWFWKFYGIFYKNKTVKIVSLNFNPSTSISPT